MFSKSKVSAALAATLAITVANSVAHAQEAAAITLEAPAAATSSAAAPPAAATVASPAPSAPSAQDTESLKALAQASAAPVAAPASEPAPVANASAVQPVTPAPMMAVGATLPAKRGMVAVEFDFSPVGNVDLKVDGNGRSVDTATAYGIGAFWGTAIQPNFSVGFAPRLLLNIKGENATSSAKELDLRVRAMVHGDLASKVTGFAYLQPGYSLLFTPDGGDTPKGFVLGLGAGALISVDGDTFMTGEVGYQWGFQGYTDAGHDVEISTNLLHLGVGIGQRF